MKRRDIVVANWKMSPETLIEAKKVFNSVRGLAKGIRNTDIIICPPFPFLYPLLKLNHPKNVFFGVQNIASEIKGAFTGEVSADMAKGIGTKFSIIGHSERRAMGESNEIIRKKLQVAFDTDLIPILCVGEKERDKDGNHLAFIKNQIKECLTGLHKKYLVGIIVAYEPIWAIGTGKNATSKDANDMCRAIRTRLAELYSNSYAEQARIQYGGSVKPSNITELMAMSDIDGALVGGASIKLEDFIAIINY